MIASHIRSLYVNMPLHTYDHMLCTHMGPHADNAPDHIRSLLHAYIHVHELHLHVRTCSSVCYTHSGPHAERVQRLDAALVYTQMLFISMLMCESTHGTHMFVHVRTCSCLFALIDYSPYTSTLAARCGVGIRNSINIERMLSKFGS